MDDAIHLLYNWDLGFSARFRPFIVQCYSSGSLVLPQLRFSSILLRLVGFSASCRPDFHVTTAADLLRQLTRNVGVNSLYEAKNEWRI